MNAIENDSGLKLIGYIESFLTKGVHDTYRVAFPNDRVKILKGSPCFSDSIIRGLMNWFIPDNRRRAFNPIGYIAEIVVKDIFDAYILRDGHIVLLYAPTFLDHERGINRGMDYIICYWDSKFRIYRPIIGIDLTFLPYPYKQDDVARKRRRDVKSYGFNYELNIPVIVMSLCYDSMAKGFKFARFISKKIRSKVRTNTYDHDNPLGDEDREYFIRELLFRLDRGFTTHGEETIPGLEETRSLVRKLLNIG